MSPFAFRCLVIASSLLAGASLAVDEVWPELLPSVLAQALAASLEPVALEEPWFVALLAAWAVASLVSIVGLLLFWRWARSLALWTTVVGFGLYPLLGATVMSGWAIGLEYASAVLWGAALAIAHAGPTSERFVARAVPRPPGSAP